MNPHARQPVSAAAMVASLWRNRALIVHMSRREIAGRYSGSFMGLTWSVLNPLLLLVVYTFVFSVVFKARWGVGEESRSQFALILFAGLIVHGVFSEALNRAPGLVIANVNYVKKVVFPLEILPVIALVTALFHGVMSVGVLLLASLVLNGQVAWTVVFLPLVFAPLLLLALGLSWMLAFLGVFVRDIGHAVGLLTTILMFVSPIFFPASAVPEVLRPWMALNPLTFIIEQTRAVLIWSRLPDFGGLAIYLVVAFGIAWLGYYAFQRARKGFADVL